MVAEVVEPAKAAAQGLAVQRDAAPSRRGTRCLQQGGMAAEGNLYLDRVRPLQDVADVRRQFRPRTAFSLGRRTLTKVTMPGERLRSTPRYELQPLTMARMENSST